MSIGTGANQIAEHGRKYVRSEDLSLAVRVARATNRPLLLFGAPGSGKSTLAKNIAFDYDLRYYEHVVTARTTARVTTSAPATAMAVRVATVDATVASSRSSARGATTVATATAAAGVATAPDLPTG